MGGRRVAAWMEMKKLKSRVWVLAKWSVLLGSFAAACGGSEPGKGSSIMGAGGSGGGGGSGGAAPCLNVGCSAEEFTFSTRFMDQCVTRCGDSTNGARATHEASFEGGELFFEVSRSSGVDAGAPMDGGTESPMDGGTASPIEYALIRLPDDDAELGGHWLCASDGTVTEPSDDGTPQVYSLTNLSDLGTCEGDAASTDMISITKAGTSRPSISGVIDGMQVLISPSSAVCAVSQCRFTLSTQGGTTAGYIKLRTEDVLVIGTPVSITEAVWVAPRHLDYHLICAGSGSTITATDDGYEISLVGLSKKRCPGTPLEGRIDGRLTSDPGNAAAD